MNQASALGDQLLKELENTINSNPDFDIDIYLDSRDSNPFDGDWIKAHEEVEEKKEDDKKADSQTNKLSTKFREKAFKLAISHVGSGDFASAVSDDIGLIIDATALEIKNDWIEALRQCYRSGKLPEGKL